MFGIGVGLLMGSYWLFHWGLYFAKGAPVSLLDDLLPSRRPTFLAAIDYMRKAGPFTQPSATSPGQQPVPGTTTAPTTAQQELGAQVAAGTG
jgi:hypothetical protein